MANAFSLTAPIFTVAQEEAEIAALSAEEQAEIHRDVYGGMDARPWWEDCESDQMIAQGTVLLHEALEQIPEAEKAEYLEAMRRSPHLVTSESPAVAFLRAEYYDAWSAAQRLVSYWRVRKRIFGADRAFLPMTLDAAMQEELEILERGFMGILPNPDLHGRAIFFMYRTKITKDVAPYMSIARCVFYYLQVVSQAEEFQKRGLVYICDVRGFDMYRNFDRRSAKLIVAAAQAVPFRVRGTHFCCLALHSVAEKVVLPVFKHILGKYMRRRFYIHQGCSSRLFTRSFLEFGIQADHLPTSLGGKIDDEYFRDWVDRQLERERTFFHPGL